MAGELVTADHYRFWSEWNTRECVVDGDGLIVGAERCMFFAEQDLMHRHATALVVEPGLDVLEIGYGLGVFAREALQIGVKSYTTIEMHPSVAAMAHEWMSAHKDRERITVAIRPWQMEYDQIGRFDSIMYDDCSPEGYCDYDFDRFINVFCARHLKVNGLISWFNCGPSLPSPKLDSLRARFEYASCEAYELLDPPSSWQLQSTTFLIPVFRRVR